MPSAISKITKRALTSAPRIVQAPVSRAAVRGYELVERIRAGRDSPADRDGIALPPAKLRVLVNGSADTGYFLDSGASDAAAIRSLTEEHGLRLDQMTAMLDFGCGCGRVMRHWATLDGPRIAGCDYNPRLVAWCQRSLPFAETFLNPSLPPLETERRFDLIYALSVLTHMSDEAQQAWMEEFHRLLKPGGLLVFTTQGRRFLDRLTQPEAAAFEAGDSVVRLQVVEGSNLCNAYHPEAAVRRLTQDFERIESYDRGLPGVSVESPLGGQDVHVVRR